MKAGFRFAALCMFVTFTAMARDIPHVKPLRLKHPTSTSEKSNPGYPGQQYETQTATERSFITKQRARIRPQ